MTSAGHRLIIFGAGGHAAHLIGLIAIAGLGRVVSCYDDDARHKGGKVLHVPVAGPIAALGCMLPAGIDAVALGIGNPEIRGRLLQSVLQYGWALPSIIHPAAVIALGARIAAGTVVDAGVVIGARAEIGAASIIEAGCSIAHDAIVGDLVHVEAGARIMSGARIGQGARIGAGAVVQRQSVVDENAMIRPLTLVDGSTSTWKRV